MNFKFKGIGGVLLVTVGFLLLSVIILFGLAMAVYTVGMPFYILYLCYQGVELTLNHIAMLLVAMLFGILSAMKTPS